ncbi:peptidoglycan-binding protein, partial [Streptosporangium algeriense]
MVLSFGALGFATPGAPGFTNPPPGGPLRLGDFAKPVERLQHELRKLGFAPGLANGYYGSETQAAVWAFQKSQGLVPRDRVGGRTWRALAHPRVPVPLVPHGEPRRVEIDLGRQLLTVYRGRHRALVSHVSPGAGPAFCRKGLSSAETAPTGDFQATERLPYSEADPLASIYETFSFTAPERGVSRVRDDDGPEVRLRNDGGPQAKVRNDAGPRAWLRGDTGPQARLQDDARPQARLRGDGEPEARPMRRARQVIPSPGRTARPRPTVQRSYPISTVGPVRPVPTVKPVYPMATVRPIRPIPTAGPLHPRPLVGPLDIGPISQGSAVRSAPPEARPQA